MIESPDAQQQLQQQLRKLAEVERDYIIATLERLSWKVRGKDGTAIALGLPPTILESRMKKNWKFGVRCDGRELKHLARNSRGDAGRWLKSDAAW